MNPNYQEIIQKYNLCLPQLMQVNSNSHSNSFMIAAEGIDNEKRTISYSA